MNKPVLAALGLALAGASTSGQAAQIVLTPSMIIGTLASPYSPATPIFDQQTGAVTTAGAAWNGGFSGLVTLDLGQAYDIGRLDLFTTDDVNFAVIGGNLLSFQSGNYFVAGPTSVLASGRLAADAGDANGVLTAQSFADASGTGTFRYLQLQLSEEGSYSNILNEFRIYDSARSPVPEPATWAMMISGFGITGASLRRRRRLAGVPTLG